MWKSYRGRSFFFTSAGLEVFPRKNLVLHYLFYLFALHFRFWRCHKHLAWTGPRPVSRNLRKFSNTIHPLLCLCTLISISNQQPPKETCAAQSPLEKALGCPCPMSQKARESVLWLRAWTGDGEQGQTIGTGHTSLPSLWHPSKELATNNLYASLWWPSFYPRYAPQTPHACPLKFCTPLLGLYIVVGVGRTPSCRGFPRIVKTITISFGCDWLPSNHQVRCHHEDNLSGDSYMFHFYPPRPSPRV